MGSFREIVICDNIVKVKLANYREAGAMMERLIIVPAFSLLRH
jgi:hypothetical protein